MKNTVSAFYANILDASDKSGETVLSVLEKAKSSGITTLDYDYETIKNGIPECAVISGMETNSIYAFIDFKENEAFEKAKSVIGLAKKLGAAAMLVPEKLDAEEAAELKAARSREDAFAALESLAPAVETAEKIDALSRCGESIGVEVCVENFDSHRSLTERKYELEWLFGKAPMLKFNLDTGNSVTCGEDVYELFEAFGSRVVNVHCKDRALIDGKYRVTAAGDGEMPIARIKEELIMSGYCGGFSVEIFGAEHPLDALIRSAEFLR